jgi:hypothetical protein
LAEETIQEKAMDEEDEEVFNGGGIHVTPQQYE